MRLYTEIFIVLFIINTMHKTNRSEETTTSKKWTELATQRQADQASEFAYLSKKEARLMKVLEDIKAKKAALASSQEKDEISELLDDYDIMDDINMSLKDEKKIERRQKSEERKSRKEQKIRNMSPERLERYQERQKQLAEKREYMKSLSKEEKQQYKDEKKQERQQRRLEKQERKEEKLKSLTPEQLQRRKERFEKRQQKKDEFLAMTPEERHKFKEDKRAAKIIKRQRFDNLNQNVSETIPDVVGHLIIDGNNMRGGGPRRHSRDVIINNVIDIVRETSPLQSATKTVYFDHKPGRYEPVDDIEVKFSGDVIADDLIVEEVEEVVKNRPVLVVTSDRELGARILEAGGNVMKNGRFNQLNPIPLKRTH